ncbi:MAG TPA: hypothetical protein DD490_00145, partial [Acidobacteria bacterium]|nr:hypothetical protein [Acidobacteriota bacterium]
ETVPVSVSVIGREDIETAPALTTDGLLRTVAGVSLPLGSSVVLHPLASFVSMRGLGGGRALVLLDGEPMNDPFFGFTAFDAAPLEALDRVEVARGGGSSLYGSYALGGTIQLLTRPIAGRALTARALYGSHGTSQLNLYGARRLRDDLGWSVNANRSDTDGYLTLEPAARGPIDVPSRSEALDLQVRVEGQATPSLSWFVRGGALDQEGNAGTRLSRHSREGWDLAAGGRSRLGEDGLLDARFFFRDREMRTDNVEVPFFGGRTSEYVSNAHVTPSRDAGLSAVWTGAPGPRVSSVVAGVDLRRIEGEDRSRNFKAPGVFDRLQIGGGTQESAGLFAEVSVFPAATFEILLGARLDHWRNRDGQQTLRPGGSIRFPDQTATEVNPRLALRWQLRPGFALRGSAYRAFRAPNLDELYRSTSLTGSELLANPDLKPEILEGAEVGIDLTAGPLRAQVNAFRNEVGDRITYVATRFVPVFTLEAQNVDRSRSDGVETMLDLRFGESWSATASYTWTDAVIRENPVNRTLEGKRLPGVSEEAASLSLRYAPARGGGVTVRGRHLGERFVDGQNRTALDAHQVVDLFASVPVGHGLELFALVENLAGERYAIGTFGGRTLGAPRQIFGGVRWQMGPRP